MMPSLVNVTKNKQIVPQVEYAKTFWKRSVGLIGRKAFSHSALWIGSCNSIHTCFMQFPLDLIFVDRNLKVVALKENLAPWKIVLPIWKARSVFELPAGTLKTSSTEIGDTLHVDESA